MSNKSDDAEKQISQKTETLKKNKNEKKIDVLKKKIKNKKNALNWTRVNTINVIFIVCDDHLVCRRHARNNAMILRYSLSFVMNTVEFIVIMNSNAMMTKTNTSTWKKWNATEKSILIIFILFVSECRVNANSLNYENKQRQINANSYRHDNKINVKTSTKIRRN